MADQRHELAGGALKRGEGGIDAVCICGWFSRGHFTAMAASVAFLTHKEDPSLPPSGSLKERAERAGLPYKVDDE